MNSLTDFYPHTGAILSILEVPADFLQGDRGIEGMSMALAKRCESLPHLQSEIALQAFAFECQRREFLEGSIIQKLLDDHIGNIRRIESAMRHDPLCALNMQYIFNPGTLIIPSSYNWASVIDNLKDNREIALHESHYFVRPSVLPGRLFFEDCLQHWNKLLVDISEHGRSFSGQDIVDNITEGQDAWSQEKVFNDVSEFLLIHTIYFNSIIIV